MFLKWSEPCVTRIHNTPKISNILLSDTYYVESWVPQGLHLSPFVFNLFIIDMIKCLRFDNVLLFKDDVKIIIIIKSLDTVLKMVSSEQNDFKSK